MDRRPTRILLGTQEAGGAEVLAPLQAYLEALSDYEVKVVAAPPAISVFDNRGVELHCCEPGNQLIIGDLLEGFNPDICVTGIVGPHDNLDYSLIRKASERKIWHIAVLDSWMNFRERWIEEIGMVALPDELAEREWKRAGLPLRISVTGHPKYDQLPAIAQSRDDLVKRRGIIDELNLDPNRKVVTFFSQPLSLKGSFPYNEFEVLDLIVSALQPLEDTFQLVVKDHPRAATLAEPHVSYGLYTAEYPADDLFVVSDVVLGMSTTQLMYAALLGIPSFSIQPGQGSETDCNLLTRLKRTPVIQSDLELRNYLGALDSFTHPKIEELTKYCDGKSCYRIERLMREVLKADYE